jgi:hypothetical protein
MFAALVVGTVLVFRELDTSSHSASDTLRPFLITVGPLWVAAVIAARIVRRGSRT